MFTGIIETIGIIEGIVEEGTNKTFWVNSALGPELRIDQSLSHNGVCLTVEETEGNRHRVTAVQETINKTSLGSWKKGTLINLERCLAMNGRLDGHLVQGHVDTTGKLLSVSEMGGSWNYRFTFPSGFANLMIEKGSICIDGISLTVFNLGRDQFTVTIIPFTQEHTNFKSLIGGDLVNLEFDMVGKYIARQFQLANPGYQNIQG